jgi:hypothetical protein
MGEAGPYDLSTIQPECAERGVPYDSAEATCASAEWKGDQYVLWGTAQRRQGGVPLVPVHFGMAIVRRDDRWAVGSISLDE